MVFSRDNNRRVVRTARGITALEGSLGGPRGTDMLEELISRWPGGHFGKTTPAFAIKLTTPLSVRFHSQHTSSLP